MVADRKWATLTKGLNRSAEHSRRSLRQGYSIAPLVAVGMFLLTVFSAVAAGPWYVSPGGGGDCTTGNPCGSIQQAVDKAGPGDTIEVAEGTYNETLVITKSVILEGGYASDFGSRDEEQYVTTIHAGGAGSVISVTMGCTPTIDGFTITGGTGTAKSGIVRGGGVFIDNAAGTLRGNTIYDNTAYRGGGIVVYRATDVVTIQGGKVISNSATDYGGGVRVFYSQVEFLNVEVRDNKSSVEGGGMYISGNAVVTMTGLSVLRNASEKRGGGIAIVGGSALISDTSVVTNTLYATVYELFLGGGGVYLSGVNSGRLISLTVVDNYTAFNGGGIFVLASTSPYLEKVQLRENRAQSGGGVYYNSSSGWLVDSTVVSNTASTWGGGIYLNGSTPSIEGGKVQGNDGAGYGGGIFVTNGSYRPLVVSGTVVLNNIATATGNGGGGIYIQSSDTVATLTGVQLGGNLATDGGGIHVRQSPAVTVTGATVSGNTALGNGGGIYATGASLKVSDTLVTTNTASNSGGGVYVENSSPSIYGGEINGNHVTADTTPRGGGLYISGGSLTMSGTLIMSNTTPLGQPYQRGYGGGIYVVGTFSSSLKGLNVRGNSSFYGGGVYLGDNTAPPTVQSGEFVGNEANQGGGIRVSLSAATLSGVEARQNRAEWGGGVSLYRTPLTAIMSTTVFSNTATNTGGAMHIWDSLATVGNGQIQANGVTSPVVGGGGGRVYVRGSWVTMSGNTFGAARETGAEADAGVVYLADGSQLTFDANDVAIGVTSGVTRAAVCAAATTEMTVTNNVILNSSTLPGVWVGIGSQARIVNNTLVGNEGSDTAIAVVSATATIRNNIVVSHTTGILGSGSFTATLSNNDVWNNGVNYSGVTTGTDDISLDPGFVSATNYQLTGTSPCVNAGTWTDAPYTDHDGRPRSDCGLVDIGAYESLEGKSHCVGVYLPTIMRSY